MNGSGVQEEMVDLGDDDDDERINYNEFGQNQSISPKKLLIYNFAYTLTR